MKLWFEVKDITNTIFTSKSQQVTAEQIEGVMNLVKNIGDMSSFYLDTLYGEVYFNPAHIVTIKVFTEGEEE